MSALKCEECGLVNFADASHCKRCRTPFLRNVSTEPGTDLQGIVLEDGYVLPAPQGSPALLGVLVLLVGIIFGVFAVRVTAPSKIDDQFVWLTGVHKDYLNQLPQWPRLAR